MPRIQDVLASIFLPVDSIYADLDSTAPPSPPQSPSRAPPSHSPPRTLSPAPSTLASATDDPFAPTSPSTSFRAPSSNRSAAGLSDSRSPFSVEPLESAFLPDGSLPPRRRRGMGLGLGGGSGAGMGGNGVGSSGIGNRSLMGLLGGTRYEPMGFHDGVGGVGSVLEEEEEDGVERGRRDRDGMDSKLLAASLPPPPSAMSPSSSHSGSTASDRDDDDPPPDFTSHIPLTSSPTPRRRTAASTTLPPPRWGGIQLGGGPTGGILGSRRSRGMGAKERALWRWINVEDLDGFLQEVYLYYVGKGIWAIALSRLLNLLTVGWVIFFSTFLMGCIDYGVLWNSHRLSDVVVDSCVSRFSGLTLILVVSFSSFYFWRVVRFGLGVRKLWEMHEFYAELLEVPENDIQTIPWHALVSSLSTLRASHPSALSSSSHPFSPRLDAHDVANRIMREENYLIALFNKDVLDLSIPVPEAVLRWAPRAAGRGAGMLTRTLEWNLSFCLTGFLFGRDGQVRRAFVSERNRKELVEALRRRFILMGLINAVFAPFIVLYLLMYSFFRYFEEYHKNPSSIGSRQFTQLARWKFREFNELPHLFQQRLNRAHPVADSYVNQFPKEKTALVSRFVAFLAGSFAAVLILFSLVDPDAFLHFEITPGRTVLFYIGVFGTVLAVARGMVPDENKVVDPEELMRGIVEHTHYLPVEWRGKLHSAEVHYAFGQLFQMKISLFVQEILSVIVTPFVLWYTLPNCAGPIVDFFREFTVHVDGLGYVCSFAVFDFKRHGDTRFGAPVQVEDDRWKSKEGKMEKSFLNFTAQNPAWVPRDQTQSLFLSKMTDNSPLAPPHSSQANIAPHLHPRFSNNPVYPHARSSSRSNRFGSFAPPLAETPSVPLGRPNDPDKARQYDQAYQRSSLASTSGARQRPAASRLPTVAIEEPIDEESGLDGDSYVATTQGRPFGASMEEEEVGEIEDERSGAGSQGGMTALLGELYEGGGKRW